MVTKEELSNDAMEIMKRVKMNFNAMTAHFSGVKSEITASTNPVKRNATALAMGFSSLGLGAVSLAPNKIMSRDQMRRAKEKINEVRKYAQKLEEEFAQLEKIYAVADKL